MGTQGAYGWFAGAPATGAEKITGLDAGGATADLPVHALRVPGLFNWTPSLIPKARLAFCNMRAGISDMKIAMVGDSTTAGVSYTIQPKAQSWPTVLSALLASRGVPSRSDSFFGNQSQAGTNIQTFDARFTSLATFTSGNTNSANTTLGNLGLSPNTTDTGALVFTPLNNFDTFDVYFVGGGSSGAQAVVSVDSGSALTAAGDTNAYVDTSTAVVAASGLLKKTYSVALGTHAIKIARNGTGTYLTVNAVECYTSTASSIRVQNMGWPGSKSADWNKSTNPVNPIGALPIVAPHLTFINLGVNDAPSVPVTTYTTNMQAIITAAKSSGDVVLTVPFPVAVTSNGGVSTPTANQLAIQAAVYALSTTNSCPVIDYRSRFIDWNTASSNGFVQGNSTTDGLHPNQQGKADIASYMLNPLLRLLEG